MAGSAIFALTVTSILMSVVVSAVQSFPEYRRFGDSGSRTWFSIEASCIAAFTVDYIVRLVTAPAIPWSDEIAHTSDHSLADHRRPCAWLWFTVVRKLIRFIFSPLNLIDAIAIFPFYVELSPTLAEAPTSIFRCLRLLRLLRLIAVGGHDGIAVFRRTLSAATDALAIILVVMLVGMITFSSAVFYCEQGTWNSELNAFARPNLFGDPEPTPFLSIPHSMWWAIVAITTIGYGDLIPTTACGRTVTAALIVSDIILLALPISVLSASFAQEMEKRRVVKLQRRSSISHLTHGAPKRLRVWPAGPLAAISGEWSPVTRHHVAGTLPAIAVRDGQHEGPRDEPDSHNCHHAAKDGWYSRAGSPIAYTERHSKAASSEDEHAPGPVLTSLPMDPPLRDRGQCCCVCNSYCAQCGVDFSGKSAVSPGPSAEIAALRAELASQRELLVAIRDALLTASTGSSDQAITHSRHGVQVQSAAAASLDVAVPVA